MTDANDMTAPLEPEEPSRNELDGAGRVRNGREQSGYHRASRILREAAGRQRAIYNLRTTVGKANAAKREDLIAYLGGESLLTPVLQETVHAVVKTSMLMDFVDGYLAKLGDGMIHKRKRKLQPIVLERQQLADSLLRHLERLEASIKMRRDESTDTIQEAWAKAMDALQEEDRQEAYQQRMDELRANARRSAERDFEREQRIALTHKTAEEAPSTG